MKNLSLILNAILFLLVGYLFMDKFSADKVVEAPITEEGTSEVPKIVYINSDSLIANYAEFQKIKTEMEAKQNKEDAALKSRGRSLERDMGSLQQEMMTLQQDAQGGNLSRVDYEARAAKIQEKEQKLTQKQQSLMADQQRIAEKLMREGQEVNDELQLKIKSKLEQLKAEKGYEYILSYGLGSGVLVADPRYDITNTVLSILNAQTGDE